MNLTALETRALHVIACNRWCSGSDLTTALGITRRCGLPMSNQGAGGWGVRYGRKLEKKGLVESKLIDGGYRSGFGLTAKGREIVSATVNK